MGRFLGTILKILVVLILLAGLYVVLKISNKQDAARMQELYAKREQYENQVQTDISNNTINVLDNPVEQNSDPLIEASDVLNASAKGTILVDPELFKRNARLGNTTAGGASADLQRLKEQTQNEDLVVLQFTAYTSEDSLSMRVTVGCSFKLDHELEKGEQIPGACITDINITSTPTTYYIPMTGFYGGISVLRMESISKWHNVTVDNLYLVNYGTRVEAEKLKVGTFPLGGEVSENLSRCTLPGDVNHVLLKDDLLYVAEAGTLSAYRVGSNPSPELLSQVSGMGICGEMAFAHNGEIIVLSGKQNGLYLIDVTDPANMSRISHYDTLEPVAGIAVSGDYVFASSGYSGVEVVNISAPSAPAFVNAIPVESEVKDCFVEGQYLYLAMKELKSVGIFDVSDLSAPAMIGTATLDGSCMSLFVENGILYAATGMDSWNISNNIWNFGSGAGNGMELFDVSDPSEPVHLSTVKLLGRNNMPSLETWNIQVSNGYAYLSAARFGLFVYDVSDVESPKLLNHYVASDNVPENDELVDGYLLHYDSDKESRFEVAHTAIGNGVLYAAVSGKGVYTIDLPQAIIPEKTADGTFAASTVSPFVPKVSGYNVSHFITNTPIWAVTVAEGRANTSEKDRIFAACGEQGVIILDPDLNEIGRYETEASVRDIKLAGNTLFLAEGEAGVEVCSVSGTSIHRTALLPLPDNQSASSLGVVGTGQYVVVQTNSDTHMVLDARSSWSMKFVEIDGTSEFRGTGVMTRRNIIQDPSGNRFVGIYGDKGIYFYSLTKTELVQVLAQNNLTVVGCGNIAATESRGIASSVNGYTRFTIGTSGMSGARDIYTPGRGYVVGKLSYSSNILVNSESNTGVVTILDVTSLDEPLLMAEFEVYGNPDVAWVSQKTILVPCHNGGLLKLDSQRWTEVSF